MNFNTRAYNYSMKLTIGIVEQIYMIPTLV